MKKILTIWVLFLSMIVSGCGQKVENKDLLSTIKQRGELVVGVKYDSKPFGFVENGKLQGYDIDVAHLMAKRILGNENLVRFVEVDATNRISKLNSGEVDILIATMTVTPQRREVVDFSVPYFYAGQAVMVRKGTQIKTIGDLNGRRVIIVLGTTGEKNLRYFAPEAAIVGYRNYKEAFEGMVAGRAEALSADDAIIAGFLYDHSDTFAMLPQRYTQEGYAIAFRKGAESATLKSEINLALAELHKKGRLNQLKFQWIPSASNQFKIKR